MSKQMPVKGKISLAMLVTVFACTSQSALASTFTNEDIAASAAGAANAVVASADDLAAAIYNPSGLAWQQGVQAMVGSQSRYRNNNAEVGGLSYEGDANLTDRNMIAISWLPHGSDLGIAASMSSPYGSKMDWSALYPALGSMDLRFKRYTVDGFYRINNTMGVAMGLDAYNASLSLADNTTTFAGSDWSKIGGHASLRWEFSPFWFVGLNVRQGIDVKLSNSAGAQATVTLPDEISLGVAHDLWDDEMRVELDLKHSKWSAFEDINVSNNGVTSKSIVTNFNDTTDIRLGAIWNWRHDTQLRFGYAYEQGANPSDGYQPLLSDQSGHKLTAGFGGVMSGMHLDVAYTALLTPKVNATGTYAARYSDARYNLMFSLTKKF